MYYLIKNDPFKALTVINDMLSRKDHRNENRFLTQSSKTTKRVVQTKKCKKVAIFSFFSIFSDFLFFFIIFIFPTQLQDIS